MRVILYIIGVMAICSCGRNTKPQGQESSATDSIEESSYAGDTVQIDQSILDGTETVPESDGRSATQYQNSSSSKGSSYRFSPAVMDDDEDAYEEARSLREEDRMNGTRSHEGDDYNGYDDDYDDGYEE